MKLIDLLVQELPKRGGWPEGSGFIAADEDGAIDSYVYKPKLDTVSKSWVDNLGDGYHKYNVVNPTKLWDWDVSVVDRSQYESALAASKQVEWSGEGLPPVGLECEWLASGDHDWMKVKVLAYHEDEVWLQPLNGAQSFTVGNPDDFRPIRTEAERKMQESINQLTQLVSSHMTTEDRFLAVEVYDAIAAGKVPGIKLAD